MVDLRVEKMSCGGCAARVTQVVRSLDANAKVDVDLGHKLVHVESAANPHAIASALSAAGYPAHVSSMTA